MGAEENGQDVGGRVGAGGVESGEFCCGGGVGAEGLGYGLACGDGCEVCWEGGLEEVGWLSWRWEGNDRRKVREEGGGRLLPIILWIGV